MKIHLTIMSLLILLLGCQKTPESLVANDYLQWVKQSENKLQIIKEIGDYTYQLQYKPAAFIALIEQQRAHSNDTAQFIQRIGELTDTYQFNLTLSHQSYGSILSQNLGLEYFTRLEYLTLTLKEDLELRLDGKTVPCHFYHFERNYNLAPFVTVVFGFDVSNFKKDFEKMQVVYNDQLLGAGPIVFAFSRTTIDNIPSLIL
jgi:hypothetical protein